MKRRGFFAAILAALTAGRFPKVPATYAPLPFTPPPVRLTPNDVASIFGIPVRYIADSEWSYPEMNWRPFQGLEPAGPLTLTVDFSQPEELPHSTHTVRPPVI